MSDVSSQTLDATGPLAAAQSRHSGARWPALRSVRLKLVVAAGVWIAVVIGVLTAAAFSIAERRLDQDLRETARLTALGVADDVELRSEAFADPDLGSTLHEFLVAGTQVRDIALFSATAEGIRYEQGTSSVPMLSDALVDQAIKEGRAVAVDRFPQLTAVATPIQRDGRAVGAVLVTVSLGPVARLRSEGRLFAGGIAFFAVLGITILIHLLTQRLVHAPLSEVLHVVARAQRGDLAARVPVIRDDEIGDVAAAINTMLTEIGSLQTDLRQRIDAATAALRQRNDQLVRSYDSVLALREELARARELATVGQTMANVAHQIGTPLNLVSAHVQLLQQELSGDGAATRRLDIVAEQVDKVTDSVRELLDRARPQGLSELFALKPLLVRLASSVEVFAAAAHVRVTLQAEDDLPAVYGDETQFELALMNLITNALDAMPQGGDLTIAASAAPAGVVIDVSDTGIGIPAVLAGRIFEPWVSSKPGRGTGLGLSITKDVVERAGGAIELIAGTGTGTTFRIWLPGGSAAS
jgi:signal transduction histidine kinase